MPKRMCKCDRQLPVTYVKFLTVDAQNGVVKKALPNRRGYQ